MVLTKLKKVPPNEHTFFPPVNWTFFVKARRENPAPFYTKVIAGRASGTKIGDRVLKQNRSLYVGWQFEPQKQEMRHAHALALAQWPQGTPGAPQKRSLPLGGANPQPHPGV